MAQQEFGFGCYRLKATGALHEIVPVFVDEPLQPQAMQDARDIEFQFLPSLANRKRSGTWRMDWKPTLPSDLVEAQGISDRVELARRTSQRPDVSIGAAIAAANVAEDIRYFIDNGFDYVCLILDGCYDAAPGHRIPLSHAEQAIDLALSTRDQANRAGFGVRIAVHASPQQAAHWLRFGIDAIAIDAWIQDRAPAAATPVESFAGIVIETNRAASSNAAWIHDSIRNFISELRSEQIFLAG
jgi:hypothetical protein